MVSREVIQQILGMAILAPSGENSQPWRFEVEGSRIRVFNLSERDQSPYNFKQFGSFVAHGALLENIKIAASHAGLRADMTLFPVAGDDTVVADVVLSEDGTVTPDPLYASIPVRVTNRKPYKKEVLTDSQVTALRTAASGFSDSSFFLSNSSSVIAACAGAASTTEKILFAHPVLHSFFFSHINWTYAQELQKRLGFYLKTLEVPPPAQLLFRIWKYWPVMNAFNRVLGIHTFIAKENAKVYAKSAAIAVVGRPYKTPPDFVRAGMATQRVWLTAASLGLSVQPLTGILFFMNTASEPSQTLFSRAQVSDIRAAYSIITKQFALDSAELIMMFRIGVADAPSAKSVRLPADITYK